MKNQFLSNNQGVLRCARYAFMPNRLSFCGPDKNKDLFEYCCGEETDRGLNIILKEFQTLYPYLKFIAENNHIKDAFDKRVVEAYWIGNELLEDISRSKIYYHLLDDLKLKKKLSKKKLSKISEGIKLGFKPHHSYHVLGVWKQNQYLNSLQVLTSVDLCRISWGVVKKINKSDLDVEYAPLILEENKLRLGKEVIKKINYKISDKNFIKNIKIKDWISFHWGFACEVLNNSQIKNLKKYTEEGIILANKKE